MAAAEGMAEQATKMKKTMATTAGRRKLRLMGLFSLRIRL
jgi:hypothetical protein